MVSLARYAREEKKSFLTRISRISRKEFFGSLRSAEEREEEVGMKVLGIIPARAGSVGVPGKNVRELCGREVVCYTLDAALAAKRLTGIALTTDDPKVCEIGKWVKYRRVLLVERPSELATATARIDGVMRHCVAQWEEAKGERPDVVALLYANVPVRAEGIIDRAIARLEATGADSVQTMVDVGKFHPSWLYELTGDHAKPHEKENKKVYRRQDLSPLFSIDGAVGVVKTETLMKAAGNPDPHAFWGEDRRGLVQEAHETVDIDSMRDFYVAEAALREKKEQEA